MPETELQERRLAIQDDHAAWLYEKWDTLAPADLPRAVLSDAAFWGADLAALPGFAERVTGFLLDMLERGDAYPLNPSGLKP